MNTKPLVLTKQVLFLATPEEHQLIKDLSSAYQISMGEVIRTLLKTHKEEIQKIQKDSKQLSLI